MLVVLDNFEHVIAAAPQLAELITSPTASKFLVTSRELLHVRGEQPVVLDPLPLPDHDDATSLAESDAVELFVDRVRAVVPDFALTADTAPAVAAIVRRLDGVPLALELAAARIRILPPAALLQRLSTALDLPGHGGPDLPARQQTLRSTIDWSYQLLDDGERVALERLSIFAGPATVDAALEMLDGVAGDGLAILESLLRKSLVRRTEDARGEIRLSLLTAIREFAVGKLGERGEIDDARDRHAGYYSRFAANAAAAIHSADQIAHIAALDDALENVAAALGWYADQSRTDDALRLANNLRWYWLLRGHLSAADRWLARLLALPGGDNGLRADALTTAGKVAHELGDLPRAQELFAAAVDLHDVGDRPDGAAWAYVWWGGALHTAGDFAQAEQLLQQALEVFRAQDDLAGQCTASTHLGQLAMAHGDFGAAQTRFEGSLRVRRQIGDPWGTAYVLTALASTRLLGEELTQAETDFSEALELMGSIHHEDGMARALDGLGVIAAAQDQWEAAEQRFDRAVGLYTKVGNRPDTALALAHLARAQLHNGEVAQAGEHAVAAYGIARETEDPAALAAAVETVACVLITIDHEEAPAAAELIAAADAIRARRRVTVPPGNPLGPGSCTALVEQGASAAALEAARARGAAASDSEITGLVTRFATAAGHRAP
jgi:predicted ATPase